MYLLETENITKQFAAHLALDDVTIRIPRGKIFGLLGPNGAGKTTWIRIINQITAADSGIIRFDGHLSNAKDIARMGYLPEERGLYKKMKIGEQALYLAQLKGMSKKDAKRELTQWFERFDIMPWWNKKLEELSKGMQQKVQFIITVVHKPDLLIFDEPFSGFDPINANLLKKELLELKKAGHTLIFSTHNMESVEQVCDDIALINQSKVILSGNIQRVIQRFKENIFRIHLREEHLTPHPSLFEILSESRVKEQTEVRIRKMEDVNNATILSKISETNEPLFFSEELPTMNEIFIRTVTNGTQNINL